MRTVLTLVLAAALAAPAYAAPTTSTPTPAPGSPFSRPVQDLVGQATTETTVTNTSRSNQPDSGRGTLLFLSLAAIVMIFAVGGFIWYEGRQTRSKTTERRRHRMRSGRTPQPATAAGGRRGPPPPPRKRRAQAAKRKKR